MSNIKIKKFSNNSSADALNQLIEMHNLLAKSSQSNVEQTNGLFESVNSNLSSVHQKVNTIETKLKNLVFHLNRIQVENEVVRKELYKHNITTSQEVKENVDEIMRHDLGVDSDLMPVGTFKITKYN